jgi:small GTP-binding protein
MEPSQPLPPEPSASEAAEPHGNLLPIPDPEESRRLLAGLGAAAALDEDPARAVARVEESAEARPGAGGSAVTPPLDAAADAPFRSGFVALIGRPNVGKSTLMNQLVGQKVAITSPVAQTTRNRLRAILTTAQAQLVLLDTPGIHKPHHLLGQRLVQSARGAIGEVDVVLLLVDGSQPAGRGDAFIVELLRRSGMPVMVALNKWDQVEPGQAEALLESYREMLQVPLESGQQPSSSSVEGNSPGAAAKAAALQVRPDAGGAGSQVAPAAAASLGGSTGSARNPGSDPAGAVAGAADGSGTRAPSAPLASAAGSLAASTSPGQPPGSPRSAGLEQDGQTSPWSEAASAGSSSATAALPWPLFPVSALNGDGCEALVQALSAALPPGPHLYPPDAVSDQPEQLLLAELIREQVLQHTREEVPHSVAVMIDRIVEDGPRTAVLATVLVERSSQKGILIGKGGSMLRTIGQGARLQMQKLISGPVYLELFVKVVPGWRSHPGRLSELGYRGD